MKSKSTNVYWRDVQKSRKVAGAKKIELIGKSFVYDNQVIFWQGHESGQAVDWLMAEKNK